MESFSKSRKAIKVIAFTICISPFLYAAALSLSLFSAGHDTGEEVLYLLYLVLSIPAGLLFRLFGNTTISLLEKRKLGEKVPVWKVSVVTIVLMLIAYVLLMVILYPKFG